VLSSISKFDYILSIGAFFEDESLKNSLKRACKNGANFVYMHPIDKLDLKDFYTQFIKYEVGSEEGICALLLDTFAKNCDKSTKNFIENLDLGYISAESSAGEEEFEEAYRVYQNSNSKALIVGDDIRNHERVENIIKFLANIKKYTDFEVIVLSKDLQEKLNSCKNFDLEEVEELKSFNGTLVYFLISKESSSLLVSQTFANIVKLNDGDNIKIITKNKKINKVLKIDANLTGTIAILSVQNDLNEYKYKQVKVQKEQDEEY